MEAETLFDTLLHELSYEQEQVAPDSPGLASRRFGHKTFQPPQGAKKLTQVSEGRIDKLNKLILEVLKEEKLLK